MKKRAWVCLLACAFMLYSCTPNPSQTLSPTMTPATTPNVNVSAAALKNQNNLIPRPQSRVPAPGMFVLTATTALQVQTGNAELKRIADAFAAPLRRATGFPLPVSLGDDARGNFLFTLVDDPTLGDEGYELRVTADGVALRAHKPAGIFYGTQTLRQLLPAPVEQATLQTGAWDIAAGTIRDVPRFVWRGTMLDIARHFFKVQDVKRYIDVLAYYKLNRLHLHLSDDQGWRIEIKSWDRLATHGGSTAVGGAPGGYYTQDEYRDLVNYAAERCIQIIPEIEMPGHSNAALASYAELNADETARSVYTGTDVGFSSLAIDQANTYQFVDDVIRELAALTPAPYIHIGGDEAHSTPDDAYIRFIERVEKIVHAHGKQMIGWEEIARANLSPTTLMQQWKSDAVADAVKRGARVILSPASKVYLDMKYDPSTKLGLDWAGIVDVKTSYAWEPSTEIAGVAESDIVGLEAPLWSETLVTRADIEYMAFPRLIGIAEIGWSPEKNRAWDEYKNRLASHGARLRAMGVNYFASPQVPWE